MPTLDLEKIKREKSGLEEQVRRLKRENFQLEERLKVFTLPGGVQGEAWRLLREYEELAGLYARAPKLGIRPEQIDWKELTSRLEKILEYSQYLPPEERGKLLGRLGSGKSGTR